MPSLQLPPSLLPAGFAPDLTACGSGDSPMAFTPAMPLGASGIKRSAPLGSGGHYRRVRARCRMRWPATRHARLLHPLAQHMRPDHPVSPLHPARPAPRRCPGAKAQPLATCSIWASDFAMDGIHVPCTSTPVLEFTSPASPDGGAAHVAGALVQYDDGREALAFMMNWCGAREHACAHADAAC